MGADSPCRLSRHATLHALRSMAISAMKEEGYSLQKPINTVIIEAMKQHMDDEDDVVDGRLLLC